MHKFLSTSTKLWRSRVRIFLCNPDEGSWTVCNVVNDKYKFDFLVLIVTCKKFADCLLYYHVLYWAFRWGHVSVSCRKSEQWHLMYLPSQVLSTMSLQNIVRDSNGEILTGKLWRRQHLFFNELPFYSSIPRKDELEGSLKEALREVGQVGFYAKLLLVRWLLISQSNFLMIPNRNLEKG